MATKKNVKGPRTWDMETDVLVVGHGYAGAVSAINAHDHGAQALVLEKETHPAGCSPAAGGDIGCIIGDVNEAFTYFKALCGGRTPDDVIRVFCEGASKIPAYLRKLAKVDGATISGPRALGGVFDLPGREAYGLCEVKGVPGFRGFSWYPGPATNGTSLMKLLMDNLEARKVSVRFSTSAKELITDGTGVVTGLIAVHKKRKIAIKARKAVILACGGFEQSEELRKQFFQGARFVSMCHPSNTGDGIRMAQKVGAALWHMWHIHGSYGFSFPELGEIAVRHGQGYGPYGRYGREVKMVWIVVDKLGRRYMNEYPPMPADLAHRPMELFNGNLLLYPQYMAGATGYAGIPSWLIFDEQGRQAKPLGTNRLTWNTYRWSKDNSAEIEKGWILKAGTLKELAARIRKDPDNDGLMDEERLEKTIARWNEIVAAGKIDPDFFRGPDSMFGPIASPPFYAIKVWPLISNTQGGPVHNASQQVLDPFGKPIPRLYAVGELGSMFGHIYETMGNIAECITSGRIAGKNAAKEKPWD
jgi:succinate dehydrogenase/fumarate reductase flavoprotein subunit